MISHVDVGRADVQLWSPDDIREDIPEASTGGDDDRIGILLATSDPTDDRVLLVGTEAQLIARLEQTIALIRRERAILDGTAPGAALQFGDRLTDGQCEALRDEFARDQAAGDADWHRGAAYLYIVETGRAVGEVVIPAGVYLRTVEGGTAQAWPVLAGDTAAYMEALESAYIADTDR